MAVHHPLTYDGRQIDCISLLLEEKPGTLRFGGARMALLDIEAGFWGLRRQMEALVGRRFTDAVLQQAGANGGASFACSFVGQAEDDGGQALRDCIAAYQAAGFGRFDVLELQWPIGHVLVRGRDAFEAWMARQHRLDNGSPTCSYSAGVLVGFVNVLAGRHDIVCVERACQGKGDEVCLFELLPADEAGDIPVVTFAPDPALGRQLNLLEIIFDRMPMGIAILDRDLRIRRFNPTWAGFVARYTDTAASKAVPGVCFLDLVPGSEAGVMSVFRQVLAGETVQQESFCLKVEGIVSYWDAVLTPLFEGGEVASILHVSVDATDRVMVETLRLREERLSLVMQGTNDGIWDWDLCTNVVYYSPRWKSMLGYAEDEVENLYGSWHRLVHPYDLDRALSTIQAYLAGDAPAFELEHRLRHRDGNYRWILARGTLVRDSDGRPVRMVGSHTDITDRRLAEDAQRESENHLFSLLETATDFAVYRLAVDRQNPYHAKVVLVSPSITQIVGISDPYRFESWFEDLHPDDRERIIAANERALQLRQRYDQVARFYNRAQERWVWVHTVSAPVFDDQGSLTHYNGLVIDVTEQKQAEEALKRAHDELEMRVERRTVELGQEITRRAQVEDALRASEAKYRDLVENANSVILQMDTEGNITFFNRFAQEFFGYTEEEILGRNVVGTIVPATDTAGVDLAARLQDVSQHPERYYSSENENVRKDGEQVWMAWTNRAIHDHEGHLSGILCIGIDRTEQKRAEEALERRVSEQAIAAERNRLARDLHDAVSQTLFSTSLIAEVLPRLWERNPEEGWRRLEEVRQLTRGALAEMRTLLLELRPAALVEADLGDLLRQLGEATAGRARVQVEVEVEGTCAPCADVKVALYRIAQEALNNVAKHASANRAFVSLRCEENRVALSVCDDGRGFDILGVPSDRFGLSNMRERAEAIGALLAVQSGIGKGTQVRVIWMPDPGKEEVDE
jgi:PAS domain S-box-containing protein